MMKQLSSVGSILTALAHYVSRITAFYAFYGSSLSKTSYLTY